MKFKKTIKITTLLAASAALIASLAKDSKKNKPEDKNI